MREHEASSPDPAAQEPHGIVAIDAEGATSARPRSILVDTDRDGDLALTDEIADLVTLLRNQ